MSTISVELSWEGHRVRMVGSPERPEWIAKDACRALGIHHTSDALRRAGVADEERGSFQVDTLGGPQAVATVTEPGLWKLVMQSRKPSAQRFKSWLASEVLPSIRQHGCYPPPLTIVRSTREIQIAEALLLASEVIAERDATIATLTPKAEAHDRLTAANGDVSLADAIRILGRRQKATIKLWLADGVLFRGAHGKLVPSVEHRERGTFRVRVVEVGAESYEQTLVTMPGLQWLSARYPAEMQTAALVKAS